MLLVVGDVSLRTSAGKWAIPDSVLSPRLLPSLPDTYLFCCIPPVRLRPHLPVPRRSDLTQGIPVPRWASEGTPLPPTLRLFVCREMGHVIYRWVSCLATSHLHPVKSSIFFTCAAPCSHPTRADSLGVGLLEMKVHNALGSPGHSPWAPRRQQCW